MLLQERTAQESVQKRCSGHHLHLRTSIRAERMRLDARFAISSATRPFSSHLDDCHDNRAGDPLLAPAHSYAQNDRLLPLCLVALPHLQDSLLAMFVSGPPYRPYDENDGG